jgi:phosphoribosylaminoimidazolecarboxamide formyltransferase/IMP cyclohydrolase
MRTALLASYAKDDDLLHFACFLEENEWELLGSAGTAKFLNVHQVKCRDVAEIVGPPILGHRVVTLSRELHAGLLATDADQKELDTLGIRRIDLVYVTLYPLELAVAQGAPPEEIIEKTDIGGPTLLRAAAKGRRLVISDMQQIPLVESFIQDGELDEERERLTMHLAAAAERRVAEYVDASAKYWEDKQRDEKST